MFTDRQIDDNNMNIAQHCPPTTQNIAQPFSITNRRSVTLCNYYYYYYYYYYWPSRGILRKQTQHDDDDDDSFLFLTSVNRVS